ncbi:PAS domain-containing protein, partial [Singulisphaera rosea]
PEDAAGGPLANYLKAIHSDDRDKVARAIDRSISTGKPFDLEYRLVTPDGSNRWVVARGKVDSDATGLPISLSGAMVDITELKNAYEDRARVTAESDRQRRVFEAALSSTPDLIYVFDLDGRFSYANEALLRMWGRTWDDSIGKNCLELGYPPWHATMHEREIRQVVESRRPIKGEVPFTGTYGTRIYEYIFTPVLGIGGEVEAVAGSTRDVTDRKQEETLLEQQKRVLELMAQGAGLPEVLDALCRMAEDRMEEHWRTSVLLLDRDGLHLRHGAAPS